MTDYFKELLAQGLNYLFMSAVVLIGGGAVIVWIMVGLSYLWDLSQWFRGVMF